MKRSDVFTKLLYILATINIVLLMLATYERQGIDFSGLVFLGILIITIPISIIFGIAILVRQENGIKVDAVLFLYTLSFGLLTNHLID